MKNELKQLATKKEYIDYEKLSQEIFSNGFNVFKKYTSPYIFLKNLLADKISINTANHDQRDFVFDLMKGHNMSSIFKKSKIKDFDNRNLYEKNKLKALEILLKCEKGAEGVKKAFPKKFNKDITEDQKSVLFNAMKLFDIRNTIINLFRNGFIKPLDYQSAVKSKPKSEESIAERTKLRRQILDEIVKKKTIKLEFFKNYFKYQDPSSMLRNLEDTNNKERNKIQASLIKKALTDFKNEIKIMSKNDIESEKPNEVVNAVEKILEFNEQQKGKGLKILTPNQMLSRLPISLAQLKAGNNSEKLKNEIRQLLYSLYRSKKLNI